jgi:hypothetical protein
MSEYEGYEDAEGFPGYSEDYGDGPSGPDPDYEPAPAWLEPITDRMEELADQNYAIAQELAAQRGDEDEGEDYYEDEYGAENADDDYEFVDPDDAGEDLGSDFIPADLFGLVDHALDNRLAMADAEQAIEQRDQLFDALRAEFPDLLSGERGLEIVWRANGIAEAISPGLVETPAFVQLIAAVAKSELLEEAQGYESRPPPPRRERSANGSRPLELEAAGGGSGPTMRPSEDEHWQQRVIDTAKRLRPDI